MSGLREQLFKSLGLDRAILPFVAKGGEVVGREELHKRFLFLQTIRVLLLSLDIRNFLLRSGFLNKTDPFESLQILQSLVRLAVDCLSEIVRCKFVPHYSYGSSIFHGGTPLSCVLAYHLHETLDLQSI